VRCLRPACEVVAVAQYTASCRHSNMTASGMDDLHVMLGEVGQAQATGGLTEGGPPCLGSCA